MTRYVPLRECVRPGCQNLVRTNHKDRPCNVCHRNERDRTPHT